LSVANEDHGQIALPKLYGAPAYARPPVVPVQPVPRPFDPDELPLDTHQTDEEREIARHLAARPYQGAAPSDPVFAAREGSPMLRGRPFRLRAIAGRIRGDGKSNGA
jgi:hypothetical protein